MIFTVWINILFCAFAFATDPSDGDKTPIVDWPTDIWNTLRKYSQDARVQLSNVIFDAVDDLKLTEIGFASDRGSIIVRSRREIYNNHDVLKTWTVIDRFKVQTGYAWTRSLEQPVLSWVPDFNFKIGNSYGVEWSHLRLVSAKEKLLPIRKEAAEIESKGIHDGEESDLLITPEPLPVDPAKKPRYQKTFSRLATAFKVPRKVKKFVDSLNDGEMVSYYGYGVIETGVGIDWDVLDKTFLQTSLLDASANFYVRGGFKVSILRESSRYARVKLSAIFDRGNNINASSGKSRKPLFEGIVVLDKTLAKMSYVLRPFSISRSKDVSRFTDQVFRYDLEDPVAREAFENAIRGKFKYSREISEKFSEHAQKPVEQLSIRQGERRSVHKPKKINLLLISYKKDNYNEVFEGRIQLPTGKEHLFKSQNAKSYSHRTLWGVMESTIHRFSISINNKLGAFVTAETFLDDSRTKGNEINQYLREAELVTGQDTLFPRLPTFYPDSKKEPNYGKSSFYFGYHLDPGNLNFLSQISTEQKTEFLVSAFKSLNHETEVNPKVIDLLLKRWELLEQWKWDKAFSDKDFPVANRTLNEVFRDQNFNRELMVAFRFALAEQTLDYFVSIQNPIIGWIYERGQFKPNIERLLKYTDVELGFEGVKGQSRADPDASVDAWKAELSPLKIHFNAHSEPNVLYFQLNIIETNGKKKKIHERVLVNRSKHFQKGWNTLNLSDEPAEDIEKEILSKIEPGQNYSLSIAYSIDKIYWGVPIIIRFPTPKL